MAVDSRIIEPSVEGSDVLNPRFRRFQEFENHTAAVFSCDPYQDWDGYVSIWKEQVLFDRPSLELRVANLERQNIDASEERAALAAWPEKIVP